MISDSVRINLCGAELLNLYIELKLSFLITNELSLSASSIKVVISKLFYLIVWIVLFPR